MREFHFEQGPIRPPSEAYGLLLWVTRNCPWNRCEFCHTYKDEKFSLRTVEEVKRDIDMVQEVVSEVKALSWKYGFGGEITAPLGRRMGIYHSIEDLSNQNSGIKSKGFFNRLKERDLEALKKYSLN